MLRLVVPRGKRFFSGVLILCADGEVEGPRGEELQNEQSIEIENLKKMNNHSWIVADDNVLIRLPTWI